MYWQYIAFMGTKKVIRFGISWQNNHKSEFAVKSFSGIFAVGDCAVVGSAKRPASGVFAVKVVNTLVQNLKKI